MRRASPSTERAIPRVALVAGACAVAAAAIAGAAACLTTPPPDLPNVPLQPPTILSDAVRPRADVPLAEWPDGNTFLVPVHVTPGEPFVWEVFDNYPANQVPAVPRTPASPTTDGGLAIVGFTLWPPLDTDVCPHLIEFMVANRFAPNVEHVFDSVGGDSVTWYYTGGGASGCPPHDAGTGAFPEASSDVLALAPSDAGGDP